MSAPELTCDHPDGPIGRVSWPPDLDSSPQASSYVCELPDCRPEAEAWVLHCTHHEAVFIPFGGSR